MMVTQPLNVLVLGASYGLLPGLKLSLAGHAVTLVGRPGEIAAMAVAPLRVDLPLRREGGRVGLSATTVAEAAPGFPSLRTPAATDPQSADFIILAMQEPQFAAPEVAALLQRIGVARKPCLSIMNLPPPPYLARLGNIPPAALHGVYSAPNVWDPIDPALLTLASPDAQALRVDPAKPGELTVTLASNFKAAPFADRSAQEFLARLGRDLSHLKAVHTDREVRLPVALVASSSIYVPLAKWPMLIAGNCRCVTEAEPRSIASAVYDDLAATEKIYDRVVGLVRGLGASSADMVPFAAYARAASDLTRPSSLARSLANGVTAVERIDRLVSNLLRIDGALDDHIQRLVDLIDRKIGKNRANLSSVESLGVP